MRNRLPFTMLCLIVGLMLTGCGREQKGRPTALSTTSTPPPVMKVDVAPAPMESLVFGEGVAKLDGSTEAPIHSPVAGFLIKQAYEEGAMVRAGDLLFEIDAKAIPSGSGTSTGYTKITSPIAGVAGRAIPGVGDLVNPGMTLATVSTLDPIEAEFALPATFYRDHADWLAKLLAMPMADRPENIQLVLADGTVYPTLGRLASIDARTSTAASVVTAYAEFANPQGTLRPGQYARVRGVTARK